MEEYKVIITTSGLGSRLGNHTKFTNKSLVRVGDKPSISHIIDSYPENTNFVITLGHFGDHVKQFLSLAYPEKKIEYVEVDLYKGKGSSLGYSLLKCSDVIDGPFIFHASDTILTDTEYINNNSENLVVGVRRRDNSNYRTINHNKNTVLKINEKGEIGYEYAYVGVCKISNHTHFFTNLEKFVKKRNFRKRIIRCTHNK
jgi:NDP-sugar pyrophosphorylase family protein